MREIFILAESEGKSGNLVESGGKSPGKFDQKKNKAAKVLATFLSNGQDQGLLKMFF